MVARRESTGLKRFTSPLCKKHACGNREVYNSLLDRKNGGKEVFSVDKCIRKPF
jgi:hypothetical protein